MKRLQLIVPMLACCLTLPCLSFTDVKDSYLVLQVDTTQKYEQYSYVNVIIVICSVIQIPSVRLVL